MVLPINPERVARLTTLGLNEQQARAYLALLDVETATVNDLARASRVPRAKLYEVLEGLSRKGLLETIPGSPQRFRANALSALYETRAEELRAEERQLKRTIGEMMVELLPNPKDAAPEGERDFLHLAKGRTVFIATMRQMVGRTEGSVLVLGDKLFVPRIKLYDDLYQSLALFSQKAEVRFLVPEDAVLAIDGRRIHVDEIIDHVRSLPIKGGDVMTVVFDEREMLEVHFLPNDLHPSRGADRIVVNRDPDMATQRAALLRSAWASAMPLQSGLAAGRR